MAMAGVMMGANLVRLDRGTEGARERWGALARRGLVLRPDEVVLALGPEKPLPRLDGVVDGVACQVTLLVDTVYCATTEVTATLPRRSSAEISVHPNRGGLLGRVREWLGHDVLVGDPSFDDPYLVLSQPREAAAALIDADIRDRIRALAGAGFDGLERTREAVRVLVAGVVTDPEILGLAVDLAVRLAKRPSP